MPYVTITSSPGLSAEQKKALLRQSSDAVVESIGAPLASVRIMFNELPDGHYLKAGEFNTKALMFQVDFISGRHHDQKAALIATLMRPYFKAPGLHTTQVPMPVVDLPPTPMAVARRLTAQ